MSKQKNTFMQTIEKGVVTQIGKSVIEQPVVTYNPIGKGINWFDDSLLIKK